MLRPLALPTALASTACAGAQAVLAPQGPDAERIASVAWLMFTGGAAIFVGVMASVVFAWRGARLRRALASERAILLGGVVLPVVTLSALLVHGLRIESALHRVAPPDVSIAVTGEQWWWRVVYLDARGGPDFETANEIHVPVGADVELRLEAADVIHSFWVPRLAGKLDMIPGRVNRLRIRADAPGVYRGQCAEYCGGAHALMAFHVVAEPESEFAAWRERQRRPAVLPDDLEARHGLELFLTRGCGLCHAVAGTPAASRFGPDLSHFGSRLHVMSGVLPNHRGTVAGWIASAQELKPANRMPSFKHLAGVELRALAAFLEGLE